MAEETSHLVDMSVALTPNDMNAVPQLITDLTNSMDALNPGGDVARHAMLIKARSLVQALETPRETMVKHTWGQSAAFAALETGVEIGLWTLMAEGGDTPQKVGKLAECLQIEESLLSRLMKHLGAMGYIKETDVDEYEPTNYSKAMSIPAIGNGYLPMLAGVAPGMLQFHRYARENDWRAPADPTRTAVNFANKSDVDTFTYFQKLGYGTQFNDHMRGYRQGRPPWTQFFPVKDRLIAGADEQFDAPFLVDIGGNVGHDLAEFQQHFPKHPGKLILQDLPRVIQQVRDLDSRVEKMEYDFFTEQPVKGARAYYMHSVLHDWPDEKCLSILQMITSAMKPGYSRLLINENVIPSTGAWWETTALDIVMMVAFSSKERALRDWQKLLSDAGLRVLKVWEGGKGVESLIECELA